MAASSNESLLGEARGAVTTLRPANSVQSRLMMYRKHFCDGEARGGPKQHLLEAGTLLVTRQQRPQEAPYPRQKKKGMAFLGSIHRAGAKMDAFGAGDPTERIPSANPHGRLSLVTCGPMRARWGGTERTTGSR